MKYGILAALGVVIAYLAYKSSTEVDPTVNPAVTGTPTHNAALSGALDFVEEFTGKPVVLTAAPPSPAVSVVRTAATAAAKRPLANMTALVSVMRKAPVAA